MDYWLTNWEFLSWAVKQGINLLLLVSSRNCPARCQNAFFFLDSHLLVLVSTSNKGHGDCNYHNQLCNCR